MENKWKIWHAENHSLLIILKGTTLFFYKVKIFFAPTFPYANLVLELWKWRQNFSFDFRMVYSLQTHKPGGQFVENLFRFKISLVLSFSLTLFYSSSFFLLPCVIFLLTCELSSWQSLSLILRSECICINLVSISSRKADNYLNGKEAEINCRTVYYLSNLSYNENKSLIWKIWRISW